MATCRVTIEKEVRGIINKNAEPEFSGFSRNEARERARTLNEYWNNIKIVVPVPTGNAYQLQILEKNVSKIVDYILDKQLNLEVEDYSIKENIEATLQAIEETGFQQDISGTVTIQSGNQYFIDGEIFPTYEDAKNYYENSFENLENISTLYDNGTIINDC